MIIAVPAKLPRNGLDYSAPIAARLRGLIGLGQDVSVPDDSVDWIDFPITDLPTTPAPSVSPIAQGPPASTTTAGGTVNVYPVSTVATAPASGVNNSGLTANTLNALVTAGTQIGKTLAAEAAPSGSQLLYNAQGQLISATSLNSALSSLTSGSSSSILILVALAAVAFLAMEKH